MQVASLLLIVGLSAALCTYLQGASGAAMPQKMHVIVEEEFENGEVDFQLAVDMKDLPKEMVEEIRRGDYRRIMDLELSIAALNKSSDVVDRMDSELPVQYARLERAVTTDCQLTMAR